MIITYDHLQIDYVNKKGIPSVRTYGFTYLKSKAVLLAKRDDLITDILLDGGLISLVQSPYFPLDSTETISSVLAVCIAAM